MKLFSAWARWSGHSVKIFLGAAAASYIAGVPFAGISLMSGFLGDSFALSIFGLIAMLASIPIFGFLFSKFYTSTTWGHSAAKDVRDRGSLPGE